MLQSEIACDIIILELNHGPVRPVPIGTAFRAKAGVLKIITTKTMYFNHIQIRTKLVDSPVETLEPVQRYPVRQTNQACVKALC